MKIGIIGCAHMQAAIYCQVFFKENVTVVGVYDHNTLRGNQFAKELEVDFYKSLEKILNTDIDTVLICSENSLHYDYTLAAAVHKKHIIIEKPLALNTQDAKRMILTCQEHEVKLLVTHPIRFSQTIIDLKQAVDEQKIGNVIAINGTNHGKNPGGWFLDKELSGGGAIVDHMVHLIDLSKWIFDFEIASILTRASIQPGSEIEEAGLIQITFTNGAFMSLDTSWNRPLNYPVWGDITMDLVTENGVMFVDGIGRRGDFYQRDDLHRWINYEKDMDTRMIQAFIECIDQDKPIPVTGEDGLYTVQIANLAYASLSMNRVIHREEFDGVLRVMGL